jgi:DNA-binding phage protein/DNA-binding Xre family transcriptional regulator
VFSAFGKFHLCSLRQWSVHCRQAQCTNVVVFAEGLKLKLHGNFANPNCPPQLMPSEILQRILDRIPAYVDRYTDLKVAISEAVSSIMELKNWTTLELAEYANTTEAKLIGLLSGQSDTSLKTIAHIETALGIEIIVREIDALGHKVEMKEAAISAMLAKDWSTKELVTASKVSQTKIVQLLGISSSNLTLRDIARIETALGTELIRIHMLSELRPPII